MPKFPIIYIDPPWRYNDKTCNGACEKQYSTMSMEQLKALPVADIGAKDSAMFMWATWPLLPEALSLMSHYGFTYKTVAFVWVKANRLGSEVHQYRLLPEDGIDSFYGTGRWTRANTEIVLLGVRGKPKRKSGGVSQIVYAPRAKHSEKPHEVRERIVSLMGDLPRAELFARQSAPGWVALGNGIDGRDIRHAMTDLIRK